MQQVKYSKNPNKPPARIDPRGTAGKNQLYTPSHMSNIGLKCFSDQDLSISLDRFNIFVKFSKISELTITNFMKKINSTPGVYSNI